MFHILHCSVLLECDVYKKMLSKQNVIKLYKLQSDRDWVVASSNPAHIDVASAVVRSKIDLNLSTRRKMNKLKYKIKNPLYVDSAKT